MRIAIVGAGAMGQLFGHRLAAAGNDVVLIDAFEPVVQSLNERGITLRVDGASTNVAVHAALASDVTEPVDIMLVFTKTMHSHDAVDSVAHLIAPHSLGVSVQNGLGNEAPLIAKFGVDRTVIGMTDYPADRGDDGAISSELSGTVVIGGLTPAGSEHASTFAAQLDRAEMRATVHADVMVPIWEKVIFNAVINTVSAASGLTVGQVGRDSVAQGLAHRVLAECFAVADAEGVAIDEERVRNSMQNAFDHHGSHKTSMLVDIEAGRVTEVESIGGAIERLGAGREIATPVLSVLNDVVRMRTVSVTTHSYKD